MDQENSVFGHFLHSDLDLEKLTDEILTTAITTSKSDISSNQFIILFIYLFFLYLKLTFPSLQLKPINVN